ncbi:MAG: hypothetical protein QM817_36750 [Archangium sp.]
MPWHVAPLGVSTSEHGTQCMLIGVDDQLYVGLSVGHNWGEAAQVLHEQMGNPQFVTVDPAFHRSVQDVALIRGWTPKAGDEPKELQRAVVGFSLANSIPPDLRELMTSLIEAWVAFYKARLWEALSNEIGVRVNAPHSANAVITVLGSSGIEHGIAFYDDVSMLDAIFSGEKAEISGASLLASEDESFPAQAFEGLGVPSPLPMRVLASRPSPPREYELQLLDASMRVLLGWPQDVLELVPVEEAPAAPARKKKKAKKKPQAKKKKSVAKKKTVAKKPAAKAKKKKSKR